jgi:hypothetical protein
MDKLTEAEIDLVYTLVDIELQSVNEGWQNGTTAYAERLQTILNKIAKD